MPSQDTQFKPGNAGRPKGSQNKYTLLKQTILEAFDELGGKEDLVNIGKESPRDFLRLLGQLLPRELKADLGEGLKVIVEYVRMNPGEGQVEQGTEGGAR